MHFYIDPIELIRILKKLSLKNRSAGKHVWIDTDKYNEVSFRNSNKAVTINTQVVISGRIRINTSDLLGLLDSIKFTDKVQFITEDPFLLIKQGSFTLKFDYLTQWLQEQRLAIIVEQKRLAKEQTKINKQLRESKKGLT